MYAIRSYYADIQCGQSLSGFDKVSVTSGSSYIDITVSASWYLNGNKSYWTAVFQSSAGNKYITNMVTVSRTAISSLAINPTTANVNSNAGTGSTSVTSNISWSRNNFV